MITIYQKAMINKFNREQYSLTAIADKIGIDWRTVKKHVNNPWKPKYNRTEPYASKADEFKDYILQRLTRYPWLTAEKLFREITGRWFTGKYRIIADYVSSVKKWLWIKKPESFLRIETPPGQEMQIDWGEFWLVKFKNWEEFKLHLFATTLSFSRLKYAEFTRDEQLPALMKCHVNAFEYFWGVPDKWLYDNMKTVVIDRKWSEVTFNSSFLDFANHYWLQLKACPPRKPHHKWKVEKMIWFVRTSFFEWEEFENLDDLNKKLHHWLKTIWNKKKNETTQESPIDRYNREEKDSLNKLPAKKLEICITEIRKVHKDCFFSYKNNCYSVPHKYARSPVSVKDYGNHIVVYSDRWEEIARHALAYTTRVIYIKQKEHFEWILESRRAKDKIDFSVAFGNFGEIWPEFYEWIKDKHPNNTQYHYSQIIKLLDAYPKEDLITAIEQAHKYKAYSCKHIKNIVSSLSSARFNSELGTAGVIADVFIANDPAPVTVDMNIVHTEVQSRSLSVYEQYS
jgi:transposase